MAFVPQSTTDGSDWHGKMRQVNIPAAVADTFLGDLVSTFGGGGPADGRAENVVLATVGDGVVGTPSANNLTGAIVEFTPDFTDEGSLIRNFHATGTAQLAKLVYGSDVIYEAPDVDGSLVVADINAGRNIALGAGGDTITGVSTHAIGAAVAADENAQLRLLGFTNLEGDGTQDPPIGTIGAIWRCRINFGTDDHRSTVV